MPLRIVAVLLVTSVYAVVRYCVFGGVSWEQVPVFVLNKAVSWGAVVFLFFAAYAFLKGRRDEGRGWGRASLHAAVVHVLLSLVVVSREYFGKLYGVGEGGQRLSVWGELHFLFGVLAIYLFVLLVRYDARGNGERLSLKRWASVCVLLHVVFLGVPGLGWLRVGTWPGGMPPISLISAGFVVGALVCYGLAGGHKGGDK
jgi:hypothetical protein